MMGINAFIRGVAEGFAGTGGSPLVERLCRANQWKIDQRSGRRTGLFFKGDSVTPRRDVYILHAGKEPLVTFFSMSRAVYPTDSVPDGVLGGLLARNSALSLAAWHADYDSDNEATFTLQYSALAEGLSPALFKMICSGMVEEMAAFEGVLRSRGAL